MKKYIIKTTSILALIINIKVTKTITSFLDLLFRLKPISRIITFLIIIIASDF